MRTVDSLAGGIFDEDDAGEIRPTPKKSETEDADIVNLPLKDEKPRL